MTFTASPTDQLARMASEHAARAASDADVEVVLADDQSTIRAGIDILDRLWERSAGNSLVPFELARAAVHAGSYLAVARRDDAVVATIFGFLGSDPAGPLLHSHVLGVVPGVQSRSIGQACKQHQRAWALAQGIERVTWTFDPLVRRNAFFNLARLGADVARYEPDWYGHLDDALNDSTSDRLLVRWDLTSTRAVAGAERHDLSPGPELVGEAVALVVSDGDHPRVAARPAQHAGPVAIQVPDDIVALRRRSPMAAAQWRRTVREAFTDALAQHRAVIGCTRDGWYLLGPQGSASVGQRSPNGTVR